jgi:ADP-L-glycero-D-manno-heptose 6-epimerase
MIIVTGGAGFIGSNIVKGLNERGRDDILVVDNLTNMVKFKNIQGLKVMDYMDKIDFGEAVLDGAFDHEKIDVIFHEGACSDTMEYNGKYMMENNFEYTKNLFHFAADRKIQFMYASSASAYGSGKHGFTEKPECEEALNVYAFSKLFMDNYIRRYLGGLESQVVGLRYFNVYGPQENHKGKMASMAFQMYNQYKAEGKVKLFEGYDGYGPGEQTRDFVYVKDVVKVNFFFWDHPELKGIYNCGTGHAHPFNTVAKAVLKHFGAPMDKLEYVPFPEVLKGKYQSYTQADEKALLSVGYDGGFTDIEEAVEEYCRVLDKTGGYYTRQDSI